MVFKYILEEVLQNIFNVEMFIKTVKQCLQTTATVNYFLNLYS